MKKLIILTTLILLALCAPVYATVPAVTVITGMNSDCTVAADNITMTCPTMRADSTVGTTVVYLSIDYTKGTGGEDTVTVTPYHNWKSVTVDSTVYYAIGKENGTTAGLMDNLYFTFSGTQKKTISIPCPATASLMKFVVTYSGTPDMATTRVKLGARFK